MNKIKFVVLFFILGTACAFCAVSTKEIAKSMPDFKSTNCKFTQEKTITGVNQTFKSGGDFQFIKNKGVIFKTTYPVQSTSNYTSGKNVNKIITGVANKDLSYLEENFDISYKNLNENWQLTLTAKKESPVFESLNDIYIEGNSVITKIVLNTKKNKTTINFKCG